MDRKKKCNQFDNDLSSSQTKESFKYDAKVSNLDSMRSENSLYLLSPYFYICIQNG